MPFESLSKYWRSMPLRAKLTMWNTFVVLLVALVSLIAVRTGLQWMLVKELEVALNDEAFELSNNSKDIRSFEQFISKLESTSAGHLRHGWFLQIFDKRDRLPKWSSSSTPEDFQYDALTEDIDSALRHGTTYRFAGCVLPSLDGHEYRARIGTSTDFIKEDIYNVTRIISPVIVVVLLFSPLGGYLLAASATKPLQEIIATSRELEPNQLDARLPIRNTGDEIDQLSAEINAFLDQIAQHLKRNREFVANAAHELRSPLTAIMASVDVSLGRERGVEEYQSLLTTIREECQQLTALVNQLMLLAESDAGLLSQRRGLSQWDEVVRSSVEVFQGVAEERGLSLLHDIQPAILVEGDATRLRQIVTNLIDNAIKYTSGGGEIKVTLRADAQREQAILTVRDTGEGIPADVLPYVFDRFYQVERSRQHDSVIHGTGLGLSICKAVTEGYGGKIECQSQDGAGSTFKVTLPVAGIRLAEPTPQVSLSS